MREKESEGLMSRIHLQSRIELYDEWQSTEKENETHIKSKSIYSIAYVTLRASISGQNVASLSHINSSHSELFVQLVCIVMKLN